MTDRTPTIRALVVIAALTVAAIVFGVGFLNTRAPAGTAAVPTGPRPSTNNPCPDVLTAAQDGFDAPLTPLSGPLPDNPTRVWLCGEPYNTGIGGPLEPLTTNPAAAVAAINSLERAPGDMACTMEYRMTYFVVVDYAEGRAVLRGELHGCRVVTDGRHVRLGGEELLGTLIDLWQDQRTHQQPPTEVPPVCPPMATIIAADPAEITAGKICTGPYDHQRPTGDLPPDVIELIVANLDSGRTADDPTFQDLLTTTFVLSDPWGSTFSITPLAEHGFMVGWADPMGSGGDKLYWTPPADLEQKLRALI